MSSSSPGSLGDLDVRALTDEVDRSTVSAHARRLEQELGVRSGVSRFGVGCVLAIVVLLGVPTAVLFGLLALDQGPGWAIAAAVVLLATVALCVWLLTAASRHDRQLPERRYRLERFAADNQLEYTPVLADPAHRGLLFGRGRDRVADDLIGWPGDRLEVANYRYVTEGYRGARSVWEWGYATAPLDRAAPELLLDGKRNTGAFDERIASAFDARTPTRLDSPDGGRFELWTWQRDVDLARRLFDGRLLSQLARRAVDLEIVGGRVFLFSNRPLSTSDPETWAWIIETMGLIQDRVASLGLPEQAAEQGNEA
ncbi:hypothetical protein [Agromyces soli]|uniref:DUF3137 domain-containing protein n=1 Tax=Agromyces soli TaxID=659012 RepID=A0ABY4ASQ5_9MICO|nr:hypothetical protein [Agromyces soli]UOE25432.1 hypothetical protein MTP13_13975 [Agromyces soli]